MRPLFSLLLLFTSTAWAMAHPVDDLLSHIPAKTAVCIVIRDLNKHVTQLADSPFAAWLGKSAAGKKLFDAIDLNKASEFELTLKNQFGLTSEQLMKDVFGEAVVFAYSPGPPERALILVKPTKTETATAFLTKLDELQKQQGDLESVTTVTHRTMSYTARRKKDGTAEAYLIRDGILIFASDEASLKSYLDGRADKTEAAPVASSLMALKANDSFLTVWLNPRSFDAAFAEKIQKAKPEEKRSLESIAAIWSSIDHVAIHADLNDLLHLRVSTILNDAKGLGLLAGVMPFSAGHTSLWNAIPSDALVAVAGRIAVASLLSKADEVARQSNQSSPSAGLKDKVGPLVGRDKLASVIEALGPDWGLWVNAPETTDAWTPDWTFALRVRPDIKGKTDPEQALMEGVDTAARLAKVLYNSSHTDQLDFKEDTVASTRVRMFVGESLPNGLRPCFAVKNGFFVFASNPERIAKFTPPKADAIAGTESPLVRISGTGLRTYLTKHADRIVSALAAVQSREAKDIHGELDHFIEMLEPVDRVELSAVQDGKLTRLNITVAPVKPLKK